MSVLEVNFTPELRPSMNIIYFDGRSKLKGQHKTIKFGSDTSLVSSLSPHRLSLETFLVTLSIGTRLSWVHFANY